MSKINFKPVLMLWLLSSLATQAHSKPLLTKDDLTWLSHKQINQDLNNTQYELSQQLYRSSRQALLDMSMNSEVLNKMSEHKKRSPETPFKHNDISE